MGKLTTLNELIALRRSLMSGVTFVLVTGVFDVLHQEHRRFLAKAKEEGDILVVGLEPDRRVRELKGKGRPLNTAKKRLHALSSLPMADYLFLLPDTLGTRQGREALIQSLKPSILAVSSHTPFQEEKRRVMEKFGGALKIVHLHNPNTSTTKIITAEGKAGRRNK